MQVGLIGAGNMARALARGWGDPVLCSDAGSGRAKALVDELGGEALRLEPRAVARARRSRRALPQAGASSTQVRRRDRRTRPRRWRRCSARATIAALQDAYPDVPVFRLMPNTPVEVRRGIVCYAAGAGRADRARGAGDRAVRAARDGGHARGAADRSRPARVMGVGPAYQALVAEAQIDAAVRHGLGAGDRGSARDRDDGGHGGAARSPGLRHARGQARGDLTGRLDRARAGGARARGRCAARSRTRSTRSCRSAGAGR